LIKQKKKKPKQLFERLEKYQKMREHQVA